MDRQEEPNAAQLVGDDAVETNWRAELPALQADDQVSYRSQAEPGSVATERFTFTVAGWQLAGAVRKWQQVDRWLQLTVQPRLTVNFCFEGTDRVRLHYGVDKAESGLLASSATLFSLHESPNQLIATLAGRRVISVVPF